MKKLCSFILCAVILLGLLPFTPASAAEVYDLKIAGVQVTSANNNNVLGDGAFSYDPGTNTLTVRGDCNCESKGVTPIINNISDLTIYVANDVTLRSGKTGTGNVEEECGLLTYAPLTVTGPGLLKLIANSDGIHGGGTETERGTAVIIDDARVDITAKRHGACHIGRLELKNCYFHLIGGKEAGTYRCVIYCSEECKRLIPKNGSYNPLTGEILDENNLVATEVLIVKTYDLEICNRTVTRENKNDILGGGEVSYDPDKNVLTLKKSISGVDIITNKIPNLTVYVANNVTLSSAEHGSGIRTYEDLTITGPGKLKIRNGDYGICFPHYYPSTVTIDRAYVDSSATSGISTNFLSNSSTLIIKNSYVRSVSTETDPRYIRSAISVNVVFEGCRIISPDGAYYENRKIYLPNGGECRDVTINGIYDLWIDGSQVAASNAYNITGTGEFAYDADENVLHVKESYTAHSGRDVITNGIPGLEIRAEKDVTLSSDSYAAVINADTTFTGDKTLYLNGADAGVFVREGARLTVDNTALGISGGNGIMGISSSDGASLVVNSSHVIVTSTNIAAVFNLASITLNDCIITSPSGARISGGDIVQSNGAYAKTVTISTPVTTVKTVNIAIPKPVAGDTVAYNSVTIGAEGYGIEYGFNNSTWSMGVIWKENGETLYANEAHTFVSGNKYTVTVSVVITDTERYRFAPTGEIKAYINSKEATVIRYSSTNYGISYTFDLTPPTVVTDIYITVPEPTAGDPIYYDAKVPEDSGYRVQTEYNNGILWESGVAWYLEGSALCPQDSNYFILGYTYRAYVMIILTDDEKYEFGNQMDMHILVNGYRADYTKLSDEEYVVWYDSTAEAKPIDEILIFDYTAPAVGKKAGEPEMSKIYDDRFYISETDWYCDTDHRYMSDSDVFEAGKLYSHRWELKANEGYAFDEDNVSVMINYETDLVDTDNSELGDSPSVYIVWTVPSKPVNMIGEIRINGYTAPKIGQTAADNLAAVTVPTNAGYEITFIRWISSENETMMNESDVFEEGKQYYLYFQVTPEEGYSFCLQIPAVYINNGTELVSTVDQYDYEETVDALTVPVTPGSASAIKYGDVNGDGKINGQDLVRLRKHLNGENVFIGPGANVNGDAEGKVNGQDLIRLRKYLNGENVVLGPN